MSYVGLQQSEKLESLLLNVFLMFVPTCVEIRQNRNSLELFKAHGLRVSNKYPVGKRHCNFSMYGTY